MSHLETRGREVGAYWTAGDLMRTTFPEPRWAVPGLLAEGLNLLVGAPKLGKSWLCLGLAVSIASGGKALGRIDVESGDVLYAALEDTPRRLQSRLRAVLGPRGAVPERLSIVTSLPRGGEMVTLVEDWLDEHPQTRLVVIDVLRKVTPRADGRNAYEQDYDAMGALKALADRHSVAVVAVHHTRKAADESDVFSEVSGSTGLTGAADAILLAKRARNTAEAVLHVTGRDVTEHEYGMSWQAETCSWTLLDEPAIVTTMSGARRRILDFIADNEGSTPQQVADALDIAAPTARQNLRRMAEDDQLGTDGDGRYFLPLSLSHLSPQSLTDETSDSPSDSPIRAVTALTCMSDSGDSSDTSLERTSA